MNKKHVIAVGLTTLIASISLSVYAAKSEKKGALPKAVTAAVKSLFANAEIEKSGTEKESVQMYEVRVSNSGKKMDIKLAADGTVVEVESIESLDTVPAAVAAVIKGMNAEVIKIEKAVEHAQVKVVKLESPITIYEARIINDGKETEIKFDGSGNILEQKEVLEKD